MMGNRNDCIASKSAASDAPRVTCGAAVPRVWPAANTASSTAKPRNQIHAFIGRISLDLMHALGEHAEKRGPAAFGGNAGAHLGAPRTVALEVPVLEIDSSLASVDRCEANLDLTVFGRIRLIAPLRRDRPSEHETARRVPLENLAPWAIGAVFLL